jgi:chromosome segregation and condensation protein ScpB
MDIKQRTEALLLAANRALTIKDIGELLEVQSAEDEAKVLHAVTVLKEEYETKP